MERIEAQLESAGRLRPAHPDEREALLALINTRGSEAGKPRRRILAPALSIGGVVALLGAGAAVAMQWGPWNYVPDADIIVAREWTDVNGASLGACESHLAIENLSEADRDTARQYLQGVDVDSLKPTPEVVASLLVAADRPDRMGDLIAGASVTDYEITHTGPAWDADWWSDARILQDGLMRTVFTGMAQDLPEEVSGLESTVQTQCTTDPTFEDQP